MAPATDFHGDQLRLSAFLRAIENAPERPKRLGGIMQAAPQDAHKGLASTGPRLATTVATSMKPAQKSNPDRSEETIPVMDQSARPAAVSRSSTEADGSRASSEAEASNPLPLHECTRSGTEEQRSDTSEAQSAIGMKRVVYTAKAKPRKRPMGVLGVRGKQPLPVNALVLTRASTEHGLPLPGDADVTDATTITKTDPIEDSQSQIGAGSRSSHISKKPGTPRMLMGGSSHPARPLSAVYYKLLTFPRPHDHRCRRKGIDLSRLGALCDGFVEEELVISTPPKSKTQAKRTNCSKPKDACRKIKGDLQLVKGFLPDPCLIPPTPLDHTQSALDREHAPGQAVPGEHQQAPVDSPFYRIESAITDQLASVTAPIREGDQSESSSSEETSDSELDWGLNDISESTFSYKSDLLISGSTFAMGVTGDLGESMYDMHNRDEAVFWSQYPGLD